MLFNAITSLMPVGCGAYSGKNKTTNNVSNESKKTNKTDVNRSCLSRVDIASPADASECTAAATAIYAASVWYLVQPLTFVALYLYCKL